ncbi:MAG: alkaline phosphatase family protein, partial [Actinomycetota bacterium]
VRTVDAGDGELDGAWMGHTLDDMKSKFYSPVWILYQNRIIKELISTQDFGGDDVSDLFFINYKPIDLVGHWYNMVEPEMEETLRYTDSALRELVRFLDREVGRRRWALALTADHGQGPDPRTTGAWPISQKVLSSDVAEHFGVPEEDLIEDGRPLGVWLDHEVMRERGITPRDVSRFLLDYRLMDSLEPDQEVPEQFEGRERERLMAAAFPEKAMNRVWRCARKRAGR